MKPVPRRARRRGFTLIEVLVALAIVAIALLAALRAAGAGTIDVEEMRARLLGGWVAENLLAEHHARADWPSPGIRHGVSRQGGRDFAWREEVVSTPHPSFRRVDIAVFAAAGETHAVARITGFVVQPPGGAR